MAAPLGGIPIFYVGPFHVMKIQKVGRVPKSSVQSRVVFREPRFIQSSGDPERGTARQVRNFHSILKFLGVGPICIL